MYLLQKPKEYWDRLRSYYEPRGDEGLARQYYQEAYAISGSHLVLTTLTPEALLNSFKCGHRGCFTV